MGIVRQARLRGVVGGYDLVTADGAGRYRTGETGLIVSVPEAEPVVGIWRSQFDSAAAAGVPAHITVLYPFLDRQLVDDGILAELDALLVQHPAFELQLAQCGRFSDVLYLVPASETSLRALTSAVAARWPEAPPYGGQFADVVPHLTIAYRQEPAVFDMIESDLRGRLPVTARITSAQLIAYAGGRWEEVRSFQLALQY
jgi:2'-5' RNA ligase